MPQNRPPTPTTRPESPEPAPAQPAPMEYTLPGLDPPTDWDPPQIRRGGLKWPAEPELREAFQKAAKDGGWVVTPTPLDVNGEATGGAPPPPAWCNPTEEETRPAGWDPGKTWPAGTWVRGDGPPVGPFDSAMRMESKKVNVPERPAWAAELEHWWTSTASSDIAESIEKIALYGGRGAAYDLIATGHDLAALNGRKVGDEEATELAILFYVSSKLNRLMAAAIDGRRGSDDTILDSVYYLMMMRRNRAVGGWPIGTDNKENIAQ